MAKLIEGNARFVEMKHDDTNLSSARLMAISKGQQPFVGVLGCVDSRVPPELVFDRGLGDVFDARIAGAIADDAAIGSLEFGVEEFGVPLLVVLGHSRCGAVTAAVKALQSGQTSEPGRIGAVVDPILPSVTAVQARGVTGDAVINAAANVAWALHARGKLVELVYSVPEANSLGTALMSAPSIDEAFKAIESGKADTLIVLENDLYRRAPKARVDAVLAKAKLIVVDPRRTETVEGPHYKAAHHLALTPGTNVAVVSALAHVIVTEGIYNEAFIRERCDWDEFQDYAEFVAQPHHSPEATEMLTGVKAETVREAARLYALGGKASMNSSNTSSRLVMLPLSWFTALAKCWSILVCRSEICVL